ncbi:MAG TPA: amidohydrolase, partial [Candidatus Methylomirabilis sp.]|nr:amidohydrolase [Candidatus Methylomirabilis sp.]
MEIAILSSRIFTGDPVRPWAEAIYVKDGKVAAVGRSSEIRAMCGPGVRVFELPGRLVTPGIV